MRDNPGAALVLALLMGATPVFGSDEDPADGVEIQLAVTPETVTVGDPFSVTLQVEHPRDVVVTLPDLGSTWGPLTVLQVGQPEREDLGTALRRRVVYQMAAFDLGSLEIPPLPVRIGEGDAASERLSPGASVEVRSVLDPEEGLELADLKRQAGLALSRWRLLLLGLVALVALGVGWWLWRRWRRAHPVETQPVAGPPPPPPDQEALEALRRLLEGRLLAQGRIKEFHVELSEIAKRYVGRRFHVSTLERTTAEVLRDMRSAGVDGWLPSALGVLLESCDSVKFARRRPEVSQCRALVEDARSLVQRTPLPQALPAGAGH